MTVLSTFWNGGRGDDLHVVNGAQSMDLRTLLVIEDTAGVVEFATALPAGVTLSFKPHFVAAAVAGPPDFIGNFGVKVNTVSGIAEVTQATPRIRSFLIEAIVTDTTVAPVKVFSNFIRVNTHGAIQRFWLTPSEIHLRQGADGQKLTLLAEFTDGRMGVINAVPGLIWSTNAAGIVAVDEESGELTVIAATGSAGIYVALPPAYRTGPVAAVLAVPVMAKVHCLPPWNTPRTAKLLTGGAGMDKRNEDDVRNIVMLSDGFIEGEEEESKFDEAALEFAKYMRTSVSARPFRLCSGRINFWTVWVPSTERGTTVRTAVLPLTGDRSEAIPDVPDPSAPAAPSDLNELILRVGYPTTADRAAGFGAQTLEWLALYGVGFNAHLTVDIYKSWVRLADLRILDERDTAFGTASGSWPQAENSEPARSIRLHPFRTTRPHLDELLPKLKLKEPESNIDIDIGDLWGKDPSGKAKDSRPHVVLICFGGVNAGARSPDDDIIALSLEPATDQHIDKTGPGMRTKLKPFAFPRTISLDARATFVHETAHAFGLLDEYGGAPDFPASLNSDVQNSLNVQPVSTTLTAGGIDPTKLKWNLPRIEHAALLVQEPRVNILTGDVQILVPPLQGVAFNVGDVFRLRQRLLSPASKVSGEITVTTAVPVSLPNGDQVKLHGAIGAVTAADFPAGSIAFKQKTQGGVGLKLIADDIAAHITTTGVALNTAFGTVAAGYVCVPDDGSSHWTVQTATNAPADPAAPGKARKPYKPTNRAFIVGAYEGGYGYHCGVLHPTGACMMRKQEIWTPAGRPIGRAYEFCAVCAYVLVDALDPSRHGALDAQFIDPRHYQAVKS